MASNCREDRLTVFFFLLIKLVTFARNRLGILLQLERNFCKKSTLEMKLFHIICQMNNCLQALRLVFLRHEVWYPRACDETNALCCRRTAR